MTWTPHEPTTSSLEDVREQIEQTRAELEGTVEELTARSDAKPG